MAPPSAAEDLFPSTSRALLHRLAVGQAEGRTPSMVGAVVRDGRTVWTGARSMIDGHAPDEDVQYRIGSITKTFVAVLVLRLRDEGALELTDPLERHLPGTGKTVGRLTVGQLLSHTSGLAAETPPPWWERTPGSLRPGLADILGEPPVRHPAGARFHYSNSGFALLGALVEQVRGEPWSTVLKREVLAPLGLTRTTTAPEAPHAGGFAVHPWADVMTAEPLEETGLMAPAGQLWSTAADLARWAAFLTAGDEKVLRPATVAEMRRPLAPPEHGDSTEGYGLGLQLRSQDGRLLFGHGGSMPGFLAGLWISAADGLAAVVLTNTTSGAAPASVAADLIRIVAEREPGFPQPWRPLPETEADPELLALTGPWYWGPSAMVLRILPGRELALEAVGATDGGMRFHPESDGTWTGLNGYYAGETLRVLRDPDGGVSHLDIGSFVLTRVPYAPAAPVPGALDPRGWHAG